jgi:tetratricopeptide (TPR) repeat protein
VLPDHVKDHPSALLDPLVAAVPFHGREEDLASLARWRDSTTVRASLRLLRGEGGIGKTRLAREFASCSVAAQWKVFQADECIPPVPPAGLVFPGVSDGRSLVVVDYAERWPLSWLVGLVQRMLWAGGEQPLRLLLCGRPRSRWFEALRDELVRLPIEIAAPLELTALDAPVERPGEFQRAVSEFQRRLEQPVHELPCPVDLGSADFGRPLDLHMAALAAVVGRDRESTGLRHADLSEVLLRRERRYWRRTAEALAEDHSAGPVPSRDVIADTVLLATLFGPVPDADALVLLECAGIPDAPSGRALLRMHERLYPAPAGRSPSLALEPLRPDPLAGADAQSLLRRAMAGSGALPEVSPRRCLTVLLAAIPQPRVMTLVRELVEVAPRLAAAAGGDVLMSVTAGLPDAVLAEVYRTLPLRSAEFRRPAIDLAQRLLAAAGDPGSRAYWHHQVAVRLAEQGEHRAGRRHASQAVKSLRRLVKTRPDLRSSFAEALTAEVQILDMANLRLRPRTLRNVVKIYRDLAESEPGAYSLSLAGALSDLANVEAGKGRTRRALACNDEAMHVLAAQPSPQTQAGRSTRANVLVNRCVILTGLGRAQEAREAGEEALVLFRDLADDNPESYQRDVALALNNLVKLQDGRAARETAQAAVALRRELMEDQPWDFAADLAHSLHNLGVVEAELGEYEAAQESFEEAVALRHGLALSDPERYLPHLVDTLVLQARLLLRLGLVDEAVTRARDGVRAARGLPRRLVVPRIAAARVEQDCEIAASRTILVVRPRSRPARC